MGLAGIRRCRSPLLAACFVLVCGVAATAFASAPTTSTSAATLVTATSATLNGSANPGGESTTGWFRYSTTNPGSCDDSFGTRAPVTSAGDEDLGSGSTPVDYSRGITGLTPATTYYYCALASNGSGTSFGDVLSFTTATAAPSVTTSSPTLVTDSTAQLNGSADPNGESTTGWFRYGPSDPGTCDDSFGTRAPPTSGGSDLGSGSSNTPFSESISGLSADTTYYVCAIAENSVGTSVGAVQSFTTDAAPDVTTSAATAVTSTSATLNGSADPNGDSTTGWFRYSTISPGTCNDTFGTRAPTSGGSNLGSGSTPVDYSREITGLTPATTYYYCAIASNTVGTSFGSVQSFATPASAPSVTTSAATAVTAGGATLNGSANPGGAGTMGWFRYSATDPGTCNDSFGTRAPPSGGSDLGSGTSGSAFSQSIIGLHSTTTYYYCAVAENSVGKSFGSVQSLTTETATAPAVTTSAATSVTATGATLNGAANPGLSTTHGWFRYGTVDPVTCKHSFGTRAPASSGSDLGAGSSSVSYSRAITGLAPGKKYYFCAVAENSISASFGGVLSFTTPTAAPSVTTGAPTAITATTAQLNGAGTANGASATGWFRYSTVSPGSCRDNFGTRAPGSGAATLGSGLFGYARAVTGLAPGTTYYVCAIAHNSKGTSFGALRSFTTATADSTPPGVSLGGKLRQKAGRRVRVTVTLTEDAGVRASGKVVIGRSRTFALKRVKTRPVAQGVTTVLAVAVPTRTLAAIKAALRRHKPVTAKIAVIARDAAGNPTTKRRKVKIVR